MFVKLRYHTKIFLNNLRDRLTLFINHRHELRKFRDSRRVRIWSQVHLSTEQKHQIDAFFLKNYGTKIPYIWHRHYTAFTGNFDVKYFPELLYIPEFEYFMNYKKEYAKVLSDKNLLPYVAKSAQVCTPKILLSCVEGLYRDGQNKVITMDTFKRQLSNLGEIFAKPSVESSSGRRCVVLNMKNGKDVISGQSSAQLLTELGTNFVIQERLVCHESIAKIYPHSVNTFRIITYRWKDEICHMPIILRIGNGGKNVDNAHAGGIFIAINDDGTLHETAFTEFNKRYISHPDTQVKFAGYIIPNVDTLITAAKYMHMLLPSLGVVNWDFTIDTNGRPVLIEANLHSGSIWLAQIAHGKGVFGQKTEEVLHWIALMKKLPAHKRRPYLYGRST